MEPKIYAIATMDTKGAELCYLADAITEAGGSVVRVDVGTGREPDVAADVSRQTVMAGEALATDDRGEAIAVMAEALTRFLQREHRQGKVAGVIGLGGSGGTALITSALRALPIGLPKLMVSTVASGNTAPYVDCSDITMMFSVVDVAGLNQVSRRIFQNAAHAIAGMCRCQFGADGKRKTLGMTMFGVTTPCVTAVREQLEQQGYDCLVFHATGTGGRAMEKLVEGGLIDGVLDITTTEVADQVVGGVFAAGPDRLDVTLERKIPLVLSLGAVDMVNFGARDTVPSEFQGRNFYQHNAQVTLMRTTPEENREIARWIARKLNQASGPWTVVFPGGGVSALDLPEQPFHDPEADAALLDALKQELQTGPQRKLIVRPEAINDPLFANALVTEFQEVLTFQ